MFKKLFLLALLCAPVSLCAQKFARYDFAEIMQALPAYQTAQTELQASGQKYESDLEEMRKEIQAKAEKFDKEINEQTPANIRERRQQELQEMYQKFQQAQDDNLEAFRQEQQQKLQPLQERVLAAVKEIITEGGYVIAFEKSNTEAAFSVLNETLIEDITAKVKAKLGI
ncbi:MAG: OmpH family outer membrane protein [Prevotellaceae bacterium]|nr:OmpH family outer membrane protein [Prevotellaceae bacterium]